MPGDRVALYLERRRGEHGVPKLDLSHGRWRNRDAFASLQVGDGFVVPGRMRVDVTVPEPTLRVEVASSVSAADVDAASATADVDGARRLLAQVASIDPKRWNRITRGLDVGFKIIAEDAAGAISIFTPEGVFVAVAEGRQQVDPPWSIDDAPRVSSLADLAAFIEALRTDLATNEEDWENPTLERFLDALVAVADGLPQGHRNLGLPPPEASWATMADLLASARIYE